MGHVIISGGSRMTVPITGTRAGDLAVGTVVKLNEGGTNVDFLVVNQGIPSNSSLYDSSCDGTWLLRKVLLPTRKWNDSSNNYYDTCTINTYLNGDYFYMLGNIEQDTIKYVKIPYNKGGGTTAINSGVNGLSTKIFLLGGYEVGWTTSDDDRISIDGAKLDYFESGASGNNKRIAYLSNNTAENWWLRSASTDFADYVFQVGDNGTHYLSDTTKIRGVRPALILPKTAIFDSDTLVLKGG